MIVFISPITLGGRQDVWSSSLGEGSRWFLLSSLNLLDSPFFTYFYSFPFCMSSSICSFRSLQSFVLWSWSLWNRQYFFLSHTWGDKCSGLGHLRQCSSFICAKILSTGITSGVNLTIRGALLSFLLLSSLVHWSGRSLFRPLPSSSFFPLSLVFSTSFMVSRASLAFIYFYALRSISAIVLGGFFASETTNSLNFNLALKVINCTL